MVSSLRDRILGRQASAVGSVGPEAAAAPDQDADGSPTIDQLARELHQRVIERLDLARLEAMRDREAMGQEVRRTVTDVLRLESAPLTQRERDDLIDRVVHEVTGLGPLEPLVRDPLVSDILVNGPQDVFVERGGRLERTAVRFRDEAHLRAVIERVVNHVGRRVDEAAPMVDARMADGSRVNVIVPPLAVDGAILSIRRFGVSITPHRLVELGAMSADMLALLAACVRARLNILVSGGTGSGKTTLLNALSSFIPIGERVITIEDAAELQLQQAHVVRLETRPANAEGRGEVVMRDLVRNALRMRPDRIIVGEVRSAEALDMLQAMNTGHEGSLTTVHANTPRDAISRLETMILYAGTTIPDRAMREQIASAIDVIIQVARLADGRRRVLSITEITGVEGEVMQLQEIFRFQRRGITADGTVLGDFEATGVRPRFAERLALAGIPWMVPTTAETPPRRVAPVGGARR
jgi:pilus assembly protein CpaF